MSNTQTIVRGRIRVVLDRDEVYLDDPGQGAPALVHVGDSAGTYWCVNDTGELIDGPTLSDDERRWLAGLQDEIEDFLYGGE